MKNETPKDIAIKDFDDPDIFSNVTGIVVEKDSNTDLELGEAFINEDILQLEYNGGATVRIRLIGMERGETNVTYKLEKVG